MKFLCIFYDMEKEVARHVVSAPDSSEASAILRSRYYPNGDPAPLLSITPADGSYHDQYHSHSR